MNFIRLSFSRLKRVLEEFATESLEKLEEKG